MIVYFSVGIACVGIVGLVCMYYKYTKYEKQQIAFWDHYSNELQNMLDKKNFLEKEVEQLKHQIELMEEKEELPKNEVVNDEITYVYKKQYKGKVIVGNYHDYFLKQAREMLRKFGLSVDCVTTGESIVDRIKNGEQYDLIITNNTYQTKMQGCDVVDELHQIEGFKTPIVVQTIYEGNRQNFMNRFGYDEYIEKPLQPEKMEKILDKFLKKQNKKD